MPGFNACLGRRRHAPSSTTSPAFCIGNCMRGSMLRDRFVSTLFKLTNPLLDPEKVTCYHSV